MSARRGAPSPLRGAYPCPNGCGLVFPMPGAVPQHLRTCATSIEQLREKGGCADAPDDACWIWRGVKPEHRRKLMFRSPVTGVARRRYVYVIAWILVTGDDPEVGEIEPLICHTCDDGRCFNPQHLFNGTTKTNAEDMVRKRRGRPGFRSPEVVLKAIETRRRNRAKVEKGY